MPTGSTRFKSLYEKHKILFAADVDDALKQFSTGLKSMHSKSMASLLSDVDNAMREGDGPSVVLVSLHRILRHKKKMHQNSPRLGLMLVSHVGSPMLEVMQETLRSTGAQQKRRRVTSE